MVNTMWATRSVTPTEPENRVWPSGDILAVVLETE